MNAIWYLSPERNVLITGFNTTINKNNEFELWIKEHDGNSRKMAVGEQAKSLEDALLKIAWNTFPSIITDNKGNFSTNVNIGDNLSEEVE